MEKCQDDVHQSGLERSNSHVVRATPGQSFRDTLFLIPSTQPSLDLDLY